MADENATAPDADETTAEIENGATDQASEATTATAEASPAVDWRADLPEHLAKTGAKFTSPADAVKSYAELEKRLGKSVVIPGKDATPDEIAAYHKRLGVPDSPDGYEITLPEGIELTEQMQTTLSDFRARMHAKGASPAVVQEAVAFELEAAARMEEARTAEMAQATQAQLEALKKEWRGADFDRNVEMAKRATKAFDSTGEFSKFLDTAEVDGVKAGDHPQFLKMFATIARRMSEDTVHIAPTGDEAQSIHEQANDLRAQRNEAMRKGDKQTAARLDAAERDLLSKLSGNAPVVGRGGRAA